MAAGTNRQSNDVHQEGRVSRRRSPMLIVESARLRKESRGLYYTLDYPEPDDAQLRSTLRQRSQGLRTMPIHLVQSTDGRTVRRLFIFFAAFFLVPGMAVIALIEHSLSLSLTRGQLWA